MPNSIGVPTARSMGSAFADYGAGFAGGAVYSFIAGLLGNGLLGSLAAPLVAGSVIKGVRGQVLSTVAGFAAGQSLLAGGLNLGSNSGGGSSRGEM